MAGAAPRPGNLAELTDIVAAAAAGGDRLELRGGGSRAQFGAPRDAMVVDMTGFSGVIDYDPAELVLTAGAGTPLAEIEATVAGRGQMLAFEPFDHGPLVGRPAGAATLGGTIASAAAGSRRLSRGGARDHLLGFKAVSGRGEAFIGGAKVVKNVTGYDLPKLLAGSWGRLAALTEVTVKVLPRPAETLTLAADGLDPAAAVALMSRAMGAPADVAAAAHADGVTALRLEGFGPSVRRRRQMLQALAPLRDLTEDEAEGFWAALRRPLPDAPVLWRISVPPSGAPAVIAALGGDWTMDWAGGLIWLASEDAVAVRRAAEAAGGHAVLMRAPEPLRARIPALHPRPRAVAALEARVRRAFDPVGVFECGRFLDARDAD